MSGELGEWLAELCSSDPVAASCVGAAVVAVMEAASNQTPAERAATEAELAAVEASLASAAAELAALLPEAAALRRNCAQAAGRPDTGGFDDITPGLFELHAEVLAELRADGGPQARAGADKAVAAEAAEITFADTSAFLARYFPDTETEVQQRSARVGTASTLARMRRKRQLTLADLAGRTGLAASEVWDLETEELTAADVADVAAYVAALAGRLELTTDLDDGQLRPLF